MTNEREIIVWGALQLAIDAHFRNGIKLTREKVFEWAQQYGVRFNVTESEIQEMLDALQVLRQTDA